MEEKQTYAEQIVKKVKEQQNKDQTDYFNVENHIEDGEIIIKYEKLSVTERKLFDEKLSIILPEKYPLLGEKEIQVKYPDEDRPDCIYTSEDTTVNFTFSLDENPIDDGDIESLKDMLKREMQRMYPGQTIEEDEMIQTAQGKNCGTFALEIPALDGTLYNVVFLYATQAGLLIGGFNCNAYDKKEWQPVIKQILASIKDSIT